MTTASDVSKLLQRWAESRKHSDEVKDLAFNSYEEPKQFWEQLFSLFNEGSNLTSQSTLFRSYNLYQDCIVRHLGKKLIALKTMERGEWREWSYDQIHCLVNYQVKRWRNQHEKWRGKIAIVMPFGITLLIGLLTAIRLGLYLTVLPLDSALLPKKRLRQSLDKLNVDVIYTTPEASSEILGKETHWLIEYLEESDQYDQEEDYVFISNDHIQLAYACQGQDKHDFVPVTAQELYLNALRDGYLTFGLRQGTRWGYCPDCSLREQPYLLFTSLLSGATTVIFPEKELLQNPELVSSFPIEVLGVTPQLRNLWTENGGLPSSLLKRWYYSVYDDNPKAWPAFIEKNKLDKYPLIRLIIDNACGGVPLRSIKVEDEIWDSLWPAFGMSWDLLQYGQQKVISVHPYGIYKQKTESNIPSNLMITPVTVGWEIATTITPQVHGYTIPYLELEESVQTLDFVLFSFFLTLPKPFSRLMTQNILLVFIDPLLHEMIPQQKSAWENAIKEQVRQSLGAPFVPTKIEFYPLVPKTVEGKVDRDWCRYQYASGLLNRKKSLNAYRWLSLLKKSALELE